MITSFPVFLLLILPYCLYSKIKESKTLQSTSTTASNTTNMSSTNLTNLTSNFTTVPLNFCNSDCPAYDHCNFYQVTADITNYECSVCKNGYALRSDKMESEQCATKAKISHCAVSQASHVSGDNPDLCWACEKNHVLSYDLSNCDNVVSDRDIIPNCEHYYQNKTNVLCNACESNYTLSPNMKKCTLGCDIEDCDTCAKMYNVTLCFMCKPNTIGVLIPQVNMYTSCLSCETVKMIACP